MKALKRFSYGAAIFEAGDMVELPDDALKKLEARGLIGKGKGKEQTKDENVTPLTEKVEKPAPPEVQEKKHITKPGTAKK